MKKLLKDILQNKNPNYLFTVINSLIESDYPVDEKLFYSEEGYEFFEEIFDSSLYNSYADYSNLDKILNHIKTYKHDSLNINKFFNDKPQFFERIADTSVLDSYLLLVIKHLDFNQINKENQNKILKWCLLKPAQESFTYIIKNYKIKVDDLVFYTAKGYDGKIKVTKSSPLNFIEINNLHQLQVQYSAYIEDIDFSAVGHSKFYHKKNVDDEQELFNTPAFHEEYNNLFYSLIKRYSDKYDRIYKSKKHSRQDQKNMKDWAQEVEKVIEFFDKNNITYYGEDAGVKQCFNLSLIAMALSFPDSLKKILKNKELNKYVDLSVKDMSGNNLVIALLKNAEIDLVNKILKINNKTINDIFYKEDNHLMASLNNTVLSFNKGKISKSIFKEITDFINDLSSKTDWTYQNEKGNILAQYLSVSGETEFSLNYKSQLDEFKVETRDSYTSSFFDLYIDFFLSKNLKFSDKSKSGIPAEHYLFDNYLVYDNYKARSYFMDGDDRLSIKSYKQYSVEEKEQYLLNFVERLPAIIREKIKDDEVMFNRETNSILSKMKGCLGFMSEKDLTDSIARKMLEIPFFEKIKSVNSEQYIELNNCRVLLEKFSLLKTLENEKITSVKKVSKL